MPYRADSPFGKYEKLWLQPLDADNPEA